MSLAGWLFINFGFLAVAVAAAAYVEVVVSHFMLTESRAEAKSTAIASTEASGGPRESTHPVDAGSPSRASECMVRCESTTHFATAP
jgi:hypothetical protein